MSKQKGRVEYIMATGANAPHENVSKISKFLYIFQPKICLWRISTFISVINLLRKITKSSCPIRPNSVRLKLNKPHFTLKPIPSKFEQL